MRQNVYVYVQWQNMTEFIQKYKLLSSIKLQTLNNHNTHCLLVGYARNYIKSIYWVRSPEESLVFPIGACSCLVFHELCKPTISIGFWLVRWVPGHPLLKYFLYVISRYTFYVYFF